MCCEHQPLVNVPLENVILDELHLMLRVTDVLTRNLVTSAIDWDTKDNMNKPPCKRSSEHIDSLVAACNSCGICFKVWEKVNADGKGSGMFDFTGLMGSDEKLLLQNLPEKLKGVIKAEGESTVIKLWKEFGELYKMLNQEQSTDSIPHYFEKARGWITLFISLGGILPGYGKKNVTPYMHAMVYHVLQFMKTHGWMKKCSGQGTEKNNDDCRRFHLSKSNKWDASADVLLVMKRLEVLSSTERTPRNYTKRKLEYWNGDVKQKREEHKRRKMLDKSDENKQIGMSPSDLRRRLSDLGIKTRVRNVKRLQEMFEDALNNQKEG